MQSNTEKAAKWALHAESQRNPIERQADAAVAQVYATMVVADRLAELRYYGTPGGPAPQGTRIDPLSGEAAGPRINWWGDAS